ncbi:MAG: glycosyltransferase [Bacteroidota bacterium]|nr:glycosyltransferase [Bacteroidota bacterium]
MPSGIFSSQVIDVVKFLNSDLKGNVKLVSFISLRNFFSNRRKIKTEKSDALVLPMFPGFHRWRFNGFLLFVAFLIYRPKCIIGRSVLATHLGFLLKRAGLVKTVIYDGRGAIEAEWKEYKVVTNPGLLSIIHNLEKTAVLKSDFRIAVSFALVSFWENSFGYVKKDHVVIPCTLNAAFEKIEITERSFLAARKLLWIKAEDILFVYSGSIASWQSFNLLYDFMKPILKQSVNYKLLFISDDDPNIIRLKEEFKHQIFCLKVSPREVPELLVAADYGLLIREQSTTNLVASPVKFAEYLASGLQVIISSNLGDYSMFVTEMNCGELVESFVEAGRVNLNKKNRNSELALSTFTKKKFTKAYKQVLGSCNQ